MSLLAELKRRQVFKVGTAYAVVAWLLIQVASIVLPTFEAPPIVMQACVALAIVGFPIALVIAWVFEVVPGGVRRTRAAATNAPASGSSIAGYLATAVLAGVVGAGSFWLLSRDGDAEWLREDAIPEIERHIAVGDWARAFALTEEAEARAGDVPALAELWPRLSWTTTIASQPAGAEVFIRAYDAPDSEWKTLGRTPLERIRIPYGLSRLRLERDGYLPLSRTVGGGLALAELPTMPGGPLDVIIGTETYRLDTAESLPEGKVRVPGWTELVDGAPVTFADYFLDRTEVTNAQFKAFVDAGGYARPELWDPIVRDGEAIPWAEAMTLFRDRTGRPGPATWEAGGFALGDEALPVAGVSWYEAAAYARFMGQELPTAYHWRRARAQAATPWLMAASNVDGTGLRAVDASTAMSYVGAYDLAGNVREWTATPAGNDDRVIAGGSWNDEPYVAFQSLSATAPRLDRSPANGLRLALVDDAPDVRARAASPLDRGQGAPPMEPVSPEAFAAYASFFVYERKPLDASIDAEVATRLWLRQRITFDCAYGDERCVLYLFLPANASPPYQTVVYWPTGGAYLQPSIDGYPLTVDFILQSGRALAIPVVAGTFERLNDRGPPFAPASQIAYRDNVVEGVIDVRRSLDYLETRPDVDGDAFAFFGHSQGGVNAPIVLAHEPRLRAGISYVGFIPSPPPPAEIEPPANPLHALPRVDVPVLLLSGEYDSTAPLENARRYFALLGTPDADKKHVVAAAGHFVPREQLIRETLDWLDAYVGPVDD